MSKKHIKLRQRILTPASLITGSGRTIQLIDDFLPKTRLVFPTPEPEKNFYVPYVAKFSPHDFLRIVIAGERGRLSIIRGDQAIQTDDIYTPIASVTVADNTIYDLVFLPNDKSVICIGSGDQSVRFIDIHDPEKISLVSKHLYHRGTPQTLSCFNDGVLSGGRDGQVCFWDRRQSNPAFIVQMKNLASVSSVVAPTNDIFITGDSQGRIFAYDPRNLKNPFSIPVQKTENNIRNPIVNLSISPNGKMMSSLTANDTLNIYSLDGEWRYHSYQWPKIGAFFGRACFSPDSRYIATGSSGGALYCFSLFRNKPPVALLAHIAPSTCIEWCRDLFDVILSCSDDKTVQLWVADKSLAKDDEPEITPCVPASDGGTINATNDRQPSVTKVYTLHHFI